MSWKRNKLQHVTLDDPRMRPRDSMLTDSKWQVIDEAAKDGFTADCGRNCEVVYGFKDDITKPIVHKDVAVDKIDVHASIPLAIHIECAAKKVAQEVFKQGFKKVQLIVVLWDRGRNGYIYNFKILAQEVEETK